MPGLMFDQGEKIALEALLNLGLTLHLYTNDYTPVDGSVEIIWSPFSMMISIYWTHQEAILS